MPGRIVDHLEIVEVDDHHGEAVFAALRREHGLSQAVVEQAPVGQAGQRVVVGEVAHLLLLALAFGHVLRHAYHARCGAARVEHHVAPRREPAYLAVAPDDAELAGKNVAGAQSAAA